MCRRIWKLQDAGWCGVTVGFISAISAISAIACSEPKNIALTDTEGRTFSAVCERSACSVRATSTAKPSAPNPGGAQAKFVLHRASRLFGVCDVWVQGSSHAVSLADCRPLTCKDDMQCPPAFNMTKGTCTNDLCIEPSAEITSEDAVLLCLAGTGTPEGSTKQIERYALGNACGRPCNVPTVCRQL